MTVVFHFDTARAVAMSTDFEIKAFQNSATKVPSPLASLSTLAC